MFRLRAKLFTRIRLVVYLRLYSRQGSTAHNRTTRRRLETKNDSDGRSECIRQSTASLAKYSSQLRYTRNNEQVITLGDVVGLEEGPRLKVVILLGRDDVEAGEEGSRQQEQHDTGSPAETVDDQPRSSLGLPRGVLVVEGVGGAAGGVCDWRCSRLRRSRDHIFARFLAATDVRVRRLDATDRTVIELGIDSRRSPTRFSLYVTTSSRNYQILPPQLAHNLSPSAAPPSLSSASILDRGHFDFDFDSSCLVVRLDRTNVRTGFRAAAV